MDYIKWFKDIQLADIGLVGGKNASLGQMISHLQSQGIKVPNGFAVTADAYRYVITHNDLKQELQDILATYKKGSDFSVLQSVGSSIRARINAAIIPQDLTMQIENAYTQLSIQYGGNTDVAVRSSATAEDLPTASFAGQQETYLNVTGAEAVIAAYKHALASLFTDRAIMYRQEQGFDHFDVALSVGVQKMIRSDLACSGVAFSLDTETGSKQVLLINAAYGLGESIVQGIVTPDEYMVHKETLCAGYRPIVKKELGEKKQKLIYNPAQSKDHAAQSTITVPVGQQDSTKFCLNDDEILSLARSIVCIEEYYSALKGSWVPMDIEWAKDGLDGTVYIIQARPETIHARAVTDGHTQVQYTLHTDQKPVASGQSVGQQIVHGIVKVLAHPDEIDRVQTGDIIVTTMTDPDWVPIMKKAAGIITCNGGRTCHAAIVARELHIPAIIGVRDATTVFHDGQSITMNCAYGLTGYIYDGHLPFESIKNAINSDTSNVPVEVLVNIADSARALTIAALPSAGVGLARVEFIIAGAIKVHPMAFINRAAVDDTVRAKIAQLSAPYVDPIDFFVSKLAEHVAMIAASFYPRPVTVRFSDFKTNEYRNLIGGTFFEAEEENPMLGLRGACRYYNERYTQAFALECAALKKVRQVMGFSNVRVMVPFVRTVDEACCVIETMKRYGLERGKDGLEVIMMCEIPSNVILIDEFSRYFDGFSIGSNDLAQMTLGVDRDSAVLAQMFDERDAAVTKMMKLAIEGAHKNKKYISICGQAPSDYPELADFLISAGIDALSLNADALMPFIQRYSKRK